MCYSDGLDGPTNESNKGINQIRKAWEVMIRNKPYSAYWIDGKEHGGYNGIEKNLWLYYHEDQTIPGITPPIDSEYWVPYDVSILRHCWELKFKQSVSTKYKWNEIQFRDNINVEMWCNGKLVYSFGTGGKYLHFAMAKAQYLQVIMAEHPFNFFEPEQENGRKICYYGMPATVKVKSDTWEIGIIPDYTNIKKEDWWKEYLFRKSNHTTPNQDDVELDKEYDDDAIESDYINWGDALSDGNINWFRN